MSGKRNCNVRDSQDIVVLRRTLPGQNPYQCTVCSTSFSCSSSLLQHQRSHRTKKAYKCMQCGKISSYISALTQRQAVHCRKCIFGAQLVVTVSHAAPVSLSTARLTKGRSPLCSHNVVCISVALLSWWLTWDYTCEFIVVLCASANWNDRKKKKQSLYRTTQPLKIFVHLVYLKSMCR